MNPVPAARTNWRQGRGWLLLLAGMLPGGAMGAEAVDCQVQVSPGRVDYGSTTRSSLLEQVGQTEARLANRTVALSVQCPSLSRVSVAFIAPALDNERFLYGAGSLQLRVLSAHVDGATRMLAVAGTAAEAMPEAPLRPGEALVPRLGAAAAVGTSFYFEIELQPRIPAEATRVAELTRLETTGKFIVTAHSAP